MTPSVFWIGRGAALGFVLALTFVALGLFGSHESAGRVALARYVSKLDAQLKFLRSRVPGYAIAAAQGLAIVLCATWTIMEQQLLLAIFGPCIALLPRVFLERQVAVRIGKLEQQIEGWLNAVANALKASPSLREAIASSVSLVEAPMSEEVDVLVKECDLGTLLDVALENLSERIKSRTLDGCVLALTIASRSGGNLPAMLENAAAALREMARLEGVVRTKTAEGKAQAFVIGMLPAPLAALVNWMDPRFLEPLIATTKGHMIIGVIVLLWGSAIALARKILAVDI